VLAYLRARALSSGVFGGSRFWLGVGVVVWVIRFFGWLDRAETEVVYRDRLPPGQSVTIRHQLPPPTRRERKKADRAAAAEQKRARTAARAERRAARRARPERGAEPAST
jgi:hypothetical protein